MQILKQYYINKLAHDVLEHRRSPKRFSSVINECKSIFFIMPEDQTDFRNALRIVEFYLNTPKKVTVMLRYTYHSFTTQYLKLRSVLYGDRDMTKMNLPTVPFKQMLSSLLYDIVIDLNRPDNLFCSLCSNFVQSSAVVGFSKAKGEVYYDMQFSVKGAPEEAYGLFLDYLLKF